MLTNVIYQSKTRRSTWYKYLIYSCLWIWHLLTTFNSYISNKTCILTVLLFTSRESLEESSQLLIAHFAKFGLEIHAKHKKKMKKWKPFERGMLHTYKSPVSFNNQNLSIYLFTYDTFLPTLKGLNFGWVHPKKFTFSARI